MLAAKLFQAARSTAHTWTEEVWAYERLRDGGITNASNELSVVLYGSFEKGNVLLTGDAGVRGLTWAANMADYLGLPLQRFSFVQIPHHGSRRNIGPTILTRLVGNKQLETDPTRLTAFVSAPKDDEEHPKKMVLNAFKRRGGFVNATQGENIVYYGGFPERRDYHPLQALPFFTRVEDYA